MFLTSRHLRERPFKELETNVSLRSMRQTAPIAFLAGRELHLRLNRAMRREGYELRLPTEVIVHREGSKVMEPYEELTIRCRTYQGTVIEELGKRRGNAAHASHSL